MSASSTDPSKFRDFSLSSWKRELGQFGGADPAAGYVDARRGKMHSVIDAFVCKGVGDCADLFEAARVGDLREFPKAGQKASSWTLPDQHATTMNRDDAVHNLVRNRGFGFGRRSQRHSAVPVRATVLLHRTRSA